MDRKIYILQKFISQTLSEEEKTEFQEYMLRDEDFRRKMIRAVDIDNSLDDWLEIEQTEDLQAQIIPLYKKPVFYRAALALVAVLTIGLILTILFRPANFNKLYKSEYHAMVLEEYRSMATEDHNKVIIENYKNGHYAAIHELISNPENHTELDDLTTLLSGISCIEEGDPILAEKQLNRVPPESKYRPNAAWYLALLNLKQNNIETSLRYLEEAEKSIFYLEKAQQLRKRILKQIK